VSAVRRIGKLRAAPSGAPDEAAEEASEKAGLDRRGKLTGASIAAPAKSNL
jgi:hypothetical protein